MRFAGTVWICMSVVGLTIALASGKVHARRTIPDDNLAYPVLVTLSTGGTGSGFFLNTAPATYLVTAKHVLFADDNSALRAPKIELTAYGSNPKDTTKLLLDVDLVTLFSTGHVVADSVQDVAVVRIGTHFEEQGKSAIRWDPGVVGKSMMTSPLIGVPPENIKRFDDVLVSNNVLIFGYPTSIGLKILPQLDYARPLLRAGIVAGKNETNRTLVIDCPAYQGNSGGPVLEIEEDFPNRYFRVIGLVSQFVPFAERWKNETHGYTNLTLSDSGYTIVVPMDAVLSIVARMEKQ